MASSSFERRRAASMQRLRLFPAHPDAALRLDSVHGSGSTARVGSSPSEGLRACTAANDWPSPTVNESEFGQLLERLERSDRDAWESLMQLVYQDLKRIAHGQMARIDPGQTLSTTVLVHEAFEKLAIQGRLPVNDRASFYALCACAMRQILIDHFRRRTADKRVADTTALVRHELSRGQDDLEQALMGLGRALELLERHDRRLLQAFEMRYFAGLGDTDIAARLDLSERSAQRLVARARSWVLASLDDDASPG
jgi:RNA polymerase sigma factor (TIGR02999 family)